jgi:hypothetical protein
MKYSKLLLGLGLGFIMILGTMQVSAQDVDFNVVFDVSHGAQHDEAAGLAGNLTGTFDDVATGPGDDTNVLLFAGPALDQIDAAYITEVSDWFASDGAKLLWMAGDSDFSAYFLAGDETSGSNGILAGVGSALRLAAESIEDKNASDASAYRVAPNVTVSDGDLNSVFNVGVESVIMHGPTAVVGYDDGAVVDLRSHSIDGVEIVIETSQHAYALDSDFSNGDYDVYTYADTTGSYPMMAVEDMGNHKYVIVTGEAIFTDYKFMYGEFTEQFYYDNPNAWNDGVQDGKTLVDNVFDWFKLELNAKSDSEDSPLSTFALIAGLAVLPILRRKFRN